MQVPNLGSHVLARVLARLPADWQQRYGYTPVLVETFVEHGRFTGGCYRAANWRAIGVTEGRGRQDRTHQGAVPRKTIWVYALRRDARAVLRQELAVRRLTSKPTDRTGTEFGRARLGVVCNHPRYG